MKKKTSHWKCKSSVKNLNPIRETGWECCSLSTFYVNDCSFVAKLNWKKIYFFEKIFGFLTKKIFEFLTKYTLFAENMFLYRKNVLC